MLLLCSYSHNMTYPAVRLVPCTYTYQIWRSAWSQSQSQQQEIRKVRNQALKSKDSKDAFQNILSLYCSVIEGYHFCLTLFDIGGVCVMMAPHNVFDHCAQTLWRRKLKLGDF